MSGDVNDEEEGNIGLLSAPDIRTGFIKRTDGDRGYVPIIYSAVDGQAIFEGCIVLGSVDDMEELVKNLREDPDGDLEAKGVAITGARFRWPGAKVPFQISPGLANPQRVTDAIKHWEAKTKLRFPKRKPTDRDFITFRPGGGCSSNVGRQGGEQFITLGPACTTGNTIHEIGHAIGLFHEQSREDRDKFVRIRFENIQSGTLHNFTQHITDGDDIGKYDFGSIMHYPRTAFSKNGKPTVEPVGGQAIGQRKGLSAGDIAAVNKLYP